METFARDFRFNSWTTRFITFIGVMIYTLMHTSIITLEMFTLHVVIVSSEESIISFLVYNNVTELKISVFKKVDINGLFQYTCNDMVERF